jgi:uncharacterized alkaline shock family protein YloU
VYDPDKLKIGDQPMTQEESRRETREDPTMVPNRTTGSASAIASRPRATELITEQGKTTIADQVVAKIAGTAAREVAGVNRLETQGATGALASLTQRVGGTTENPAQGVRVEVGEREAAIDIKMSVQYGVSIPQVAEAVRDNIINRVQSMTGLSVKEVNVEVSDIMLPEEEATEQPKPRVE